MLKFSGKYTVVCKDKSGRIKWRNVAYNAIVNQGLDEILKIMFVAGAQVATWYVGLIDDASFSALANTDTLNVHAGWLEFADYTGDRKTAQFDAVIGQRTEITGSVDFVFTEAGVIKGLFLSDQEIGNIGILWSTALFTAGDQTVGLGDTISVDYEITAARA